MGRRYFAYGSNLDREQMAERCPQSVSGDPAMLKDWSFSIMTEGWATITPASGREVYGLIWSIPETDLAALDEYEGVAEGLYRRSSVLVIDSGGQELETDVYIGSNSGPGAPSDDYIDAIIESLSDLDVPRTYLEHVRSWHPNAGETL